MNGLPRNAQTIFSALNESRRDPRPAGQQQRGGGSVCPCWFIVRLTLLAAVIGLTTSAFAQGPATLDVEEAKKDADFPFLGEYAGTD